MTAHPYFGTRLVKQGISFKLEENDADFPVLRTELKDAVEFGDDTNSGEKIQKLTEEIIMAKEEKKNNNQIENAEEFSKFLTEEELDRVSGGASLSWCPACGGKAQSGRTCPLCKGRGFIIK